MPGKLGPAWGFRPGWGHRGGWQYADLPSVDDAAPWITGRLPDNWFVAPPEISIDRDEIIIVGRLPDPEANLLSPDASPAERAGVEKGRIARFREHTREQRMEIAQHIQHRYGRKVSWGARCGGTQELFTTQSVPVMTRLRQPERQVLDTLVDAGVARSRSDALAWCVRLVAQHAESWLSELQKAMTEVDRLRREGPTITT